MLIVFVGRIACRDCCCKSPETYHSPKHDARHLNPSAWRATGCHAQDSARRAPPFTPPKKLRRAIRKPLRKLAKRTLLKRPPPRMQSKAARAAATRRAPQHSSLRHTLAARHAKTAAARRRGGPDCAQPRCARGNLKGRPKAWTKMTRGTSGAKAPDRNRGRAQSGPLRRRATYEDRQPSHEDHPPPHEDHQPPQKKLPLNSKPVLLEPIQHPRPSLLRLRLPIRRPIVRMKRMRRIRIDIDP